jgi:seryl-tRNA synthetase
MLYLIHKVKDLKKTLDNIDDDATIVLQIENEETEETYIGMNDDVKVEYDSISNVVVLCASFTDLV